MSDVTKILHQIERGDSAAAEQLLPLVYDELRKLAAQNMRQEKPGQTLQATALVHEAYLRLVDVEKSQHWNSRGHFFGAAAEAMRRLLVDNAKRKAAFKRGGQFERIDFGEAEKAVTDRSIDLIALNDALDRLEADEPRKAELVKLRFFAGFSIRESADLLGISESTADADWAYAKAWLRRQIGS